MDERLNRIEGKIDSVKDELVTIKLGYQEHERRSLANEESLELLKTKVEPVLLQINFVHKLDHGTGWKKCITCASCVKIQTEGRHCIDCNLKSECCREKSSVTKVTE